MEKISIRLNRERDGGYESGAGQYVPAAPYRGRFLPPGGVTDRMLPAIRGEFRIDVREHDDEVIVIADLPGVEKEDVSLQIRTRETLRSRVNAKVRKRKNLKATLSGYKDQCNGLLQCPQMWQ